MPRVIIGTTPVQLAWANNKRRKWELQFIPSSIINTNTGKIYVKRGSAPKADDASNTWDNVLNPGAVVGDNLDDSQEKSPWLGDIWAVSDTSGQICTFEEYNIQETPKPTS